MIDRFYVVFGAVSLLLVGLVHAADNHDLFVKEEKLVLEKSGPAQSRISRPPSTLASDRPVTWNYLDPEHKEVKDLRVFGYNRNSLREQPIDTQLSIVSHLLIAAPRREVNAIYKKNLCEKDAMGISEMLFVIPASNIIERQLNRATDALGGSGRRCARFTGRTLTLLAFDQGVEIQGYREPTLTFGDMRADPKNHFLVTKFEEIDCM